MRCPDCGRFVGTDGPAWALKCACPAPCWRCGDVHAPGGGCGETAPGAGLKPDPAIVSELVDEYYGAQSLGELEGVRDRLDALHGAPAAPAKHPCAKCDGERHMDCAFASGIPECDALRAWIAAAMPIDDQVRAIRADLLVGNRTCSSIAECMGRDDLVRELAMAGITGVAAAVRWARKHEEQFLEQGLNQREGNDDDWQLAAWREFRAADKANPV